MERIVEQIYFLDNAYFVGYIKQKNMMKKNIILGIIMSVILFSCSKKEKVEPKVEEPKNQIVTYTDLEFAIEGNEADYGSFFSFETEKMYKVDEINDENGSKIDLAFTSYGNSLYFFDSPDENHDIPNAKHTKTINYESSNPRISGDDFDTLVSDSLYVKLENLTFEGYQSDSFITSHIPGTIVFEIADGRRGVIKTKKVNASRLLVDIKIQKD